MMQEPEDEVVGEAGRLSRSASMMGMKLADVLLRMRERQERRAADAQREAAAALGEMRQAQREGAHELIKPALDPDWRDRASNQDLARAFVYAEAYADSSPLAGVVRDQLEQHIGAQHDNVAQFVDQNVSERDLERVPAPSGHLSPTQERLLDRREQDALASAEQEKGTPVDRAKAVAGEEKADAYANVAEIRGQDAANVWLQDALDEDALAELTKWERWDEAERERGEADLEREAATDAETEEEAAEHADDAAEREAKAESLEEQGDMEHAGVGQFQRSQQDLQRVEAQDSEAGESLRVARAGRTQGAAQQVAEHRNTHRGEPRKTARRAPQLDRDHDRGR